uniref:Uncharacterized protein n=1 Tax=Echeneis naucrates TaxID=173247 RepID=A0A665W7P0_ECHNA
MEQNKPGACFGQSQQCHTLPISMAPPLTGRDGEGGEASPSSGEWGEAWWQMCSVAPPVVRPGHGERERDRGQRGDLPVQRARQEELVEDHHGDGLAEDDQVCTEFSSDSSD